MNLGTSNNRWKQLFAATPEIATSDRNLKNNIMPLSEQYMKFFMMLMPVSFTFKNGESGRTHVGFISQDVEQSMKKVGLTDIDFAGFCKDIKTICHVDENGNEVEEPILDENGNPEYVYSLRYEEFIAINTYVLQKTINRLNDYESRLADLEKSILQMKDEC